MMNQSLEETDIYGRKNSTRGDEEKVEGSDQVGNENTCTRHILSGINVDIRVT